MFVDFCDVYDKFFPVYLIHPAQLLFTCCKDIGGRVPTISELRALFQDSPQTEYPKPEDQNPRCDVSDVLLEGGVKDSVQ